MPEYHGGSAPDLGVQALSSSVQLYSSLAEFNAAHSDPVKELFCGNIFIVKGAFKSLGLLDRYTGLFLSAIEKVAGGERRAAVEKDGLESIHRYVANKDLINVTTVARDLVDEFMHDDLTGLVQALFATRRFLYCKDPIVRIHVPFDLVAREPEYVPVFRMFGGGGKLGAHAPHTDSSVKCPSNSINLWISIGATNKGNGISIWPQHHGSQVVVDRNANSYRNYMLGRPVNFDLEPGDMVLFHGDHVHGSELNSTDRTRASISYRITLDNPVFTVPSGQVYLDSVTGSPFKDIKIRCDGKPELAMVGISEFDGADSEFGTKGPIVPEGRGRARVRLEGGETVSIQRHCTHEGADLCGGWVENDRIYCPRHNLPFDLRTGKSSCGSLKSLKIYS